MKSGGNTRGRGVLNDRNSSYKKERNDYTSKEKSLQLIIFFSFSVLFCLRDRQTFADTADSELQTVKQAKLVFIYRCALCV